MYGGNDGNSSDGDTFAPAGGFVLAHEIGHNFGRRHVDCGNPDGPDAGYPFDDCVFAPRDEQGNYLGYDLLDPSNPGIVNPTVGGPSVGIGDLMSYSDRSWTSPYTYNAIGQKYCSQSGECLWSTTGFLFHEDPVPSPETLERLRQAGEMLVVAGTIAADDTTTISLIAREADTTMPAEKLEKLYLKNAVLDRRDTDYEIALLDAGGNVVSSQVFAPDELSAREDSVAFFDVTLPFEEESTEIAVRKEGVILASRIVSNSAPAVTLIKPNGGEDVGIELDVEWDASDADGDTLSFMIQYSPDDGESWHVVAAGIPGDPTGSYSRTVNLAYEPGSNNALLRVIANDGVQTGMAESPSFDVDERTPEVHVTSPKEGETYPPKALLRFAAEAFDPEEGVLEGASMEWKEDQSVIGNGRSFTVRDLEPGTHLVTVEATDAEGNEAAATVSFEIAPEKLSRPDVADFLLGKRSADLNAADRNEDAVIDAGDLAR